MVEKIRHIIYITLIYIFKECEIIFAVKINLEFFFAKKYFIVKLPNIIILRE